MRRAVSVLSFLLLTLPHSGVAAINSNETDFDQGLNLPKLLGEIRSRAAVDSDPKSELANPVIAGIIPLATRHSLPSELINRRRSVSARPYFYGPWRPKIEGRVEYKEGQQYPPLVRQLPPESRDPLESEWDGIEAERKALLSDADQLEPEDIQLATDGDWLLAENEALDKELAAIEQDRTNYRARCNVARPPSDCEAIRGRLNARVTRYNERNKVFNTKLEDWQRRRPEIENRGKKIDSNTDAWGLKINAYSKRAEQALEGAGWSTVIYQAQGDDMGGREIVLRSRSATPICKTEGIAKLDQLMGFLTDRQRSERNAEAITRAKAFVAITDHKVPPPVFRTFQNTNRQVANARIDIEILTGRAFAPCDVGIGD